MKRLNCNLRVVFCSWDWLLSHPRPGEVLKCLGYNSLLFESLLLEDTRADAGEQSEAL